MASQGKLLFDLNELPTEDDDDVQQSATPSANSNASGLLPTPSCSQDKVNNRVFLHASTASGFQPFVRPAAPQQTDVAVERKTGGFDEAKVASSDVRSNAGASEREEGELTDSEVPPNENVHSSFDCKGVPSREPAMSETGVSSDHSKVTEKDNSTVGLDINSNPGLHKRNSNLLPEGSAKDGLTVKQRESKGVEASHAIKCANTTMKRKLDQQKETMLGKKRNRQTMFLNLEDVKQAGPIKTTTPRRQNFPQPVVTRTVRESSRAGPRPPAEQGGGDARPSSDGTSTSVSRQGSWKQPINSRNRQVSLSSQSSADSKVGNKKFTSFKKPSLHSHIVDESHGFSINNST